MADVKVRKLPDWILDVYRLRAQARGHSSAALTRKVRIGEILPEEAETACRLWFAALARGVVSLSPHEENIGVAMKIAI